MSPVTKTLPSATNEWCAASGLRPRAALLAVMAGLTLVAAGCASVATGTPEEIVAQRADQRWKLMMGDQFAQSYELTAPSYRAVTSAKVYREQYGAANLWTAAKVVKVTCSTDVACAAILEISVKNITPMKGMPVLTTAVDEAWVKEDGKWYFLPKL